MNCTCMLVCEFLSHQHGLESDLYIELLKGHFTMFLNFSMLHIDALPICSIVYGSMMHLIEQGNYICHIIGPFLKAWSAQLLTNSC